MLNIEITENAAREIRKILLDSSFSRSRYLRIGIKGGGCGGLTYTMDLCSQPDREDNIVETSGIHLVCDPVSGLYLDGTIIDFTYDLIRQGFVFNNPNARHLCRCGVSFAI